MDKPADWFYVMVLRRAARDALRMGITVQGIFGGAVFGLAVSGFTYLLTDEADRADFGVGTGATAFLIVGAAWLLGVALWSLAWAPVSIYREEEAAHSSLRAATSAAEEKAHNLTDLARLFQEGQMLRLTTITSDAELDRWAAEVLPWTERVGRELSHAESASFLDVTAIEVRADHPGAFNPVHGGRLSVLDRQLSNLMRVMDRRASS